MLTFKPEHRRILLQRGVIPPLITPVEAADPIVDLVAVNQPYSMAATFVLTL
jgi:hypothetical protein